MTGELSPADRPAERAIQADLRASHTDRDRVVELLRMAAGDGRLTAEELDERLEAALTARTYSDLAVLTVDLPTAGAAPGAAALSRPAAKDLVVIDCASGSAKRDGNWLVPQRMEVRVMSGHVTLDLTKAVITNPTLQLHAEVRSGTVTIVTRPGIEIDTDDIAVRSGAVTVRAHKTANTGPVPVILRVEVSGKVGSGSLKARPPRRTLWQWLRRRPLTY